MGLEVTYKRNKRLCKNLVSTLPYSAKPMYMNGKWRSPMIKKRELKALERAAVYHQLDFPHDIWDIISKKRKKKTATTLDELIGQNQHNWIRNRRNDSEYLKKKDKIEKICKALKSMPKKIEEHREELRDRKWKDPMEIMRYKQSIVKRDKIYVQTRMNRQGSWNVKIEEDEI